MMPCVSYNAQVPSQWTLLVTGITSSVLVRGRRFCVITLLGSSSMLLVALTLSKQCEGSRGLAPYVQVTVAVYVDYH